MANVNDVKAAVANGGEKGLMKPADRLETLLARVDIKGRFQEILGKKAPGFISSIISAVNTNGALKVCDPKSVLGSAVVAATLDLPINSNLGFAHIVPYKNVAQFQMGWKGFVQLGIRTAQYKTMHASEVYADELDFWNPITGEFKLTDQASWKQREAGETEKIVGYVAFFKLINGFEKYLYMTKEQVKRHGKKYSKSFDNERGQWALNFNAMALKTVLKLLLSKYGILSIEMQRAIQADQAVTVETDPEKQQFDYQDAVEGEADAEAEKPAPAAEPEKKNGTTKAEDIPFGE